VRARVYILTLSYIASLSPLNWIIVLVIRMVYYGLFLPFISSVTK
jgi:capsule polysaccharide export protein KpsE/RkpR